MRYLKYMVLLLALVAIPSVHSQAQVAVGVQIGPSYGLYNAPPVCEYGFYPTYPFDCAPYGYYGPNYFVDGVFIGVGPWSNFYYSHAGFYRPFYFNRGFGFHGGYRAFGSDRFRGGEFRGERFRDDHFRGNEFRGDRFAGNDRFRGNVSHGFVDNRSYRSSGNYGNYRSSGNYGHGSYNSGNYNHGSYNSGNHGYGMSGHGSSGNSYHGGGSSYHSGGNSYHGGGNSYTGGSHSSGGSHNSGSNYHGR